MAYNAPWFPPDGTIPFPQDEWDAWLDRWTNAEPERFCGYLQREDGALVGEVCWHSFGREMGVVIHAPFRRMGYGRQGLALLVERAFRHGEISVLENTFESERDGALALHLQAGFVPVGQRDGMLCVRLTRERRTARIRQMQLADVFDAMCDWDAGNPHRIHHFTKVHGFARQIALCEGMDENTLFVLEAAALTHDIGIKPADEQQGSHPGPVQEKLGQPAAEQMLTLLGLPAPVVRRVGFLVGKHHTTQHVAGLDWQILLEADFLVNMIEGNCTDEAIDHFRDTVFCTSEVKRLLEKIRPVKKG